MNKIIERYRKIQRYSILEREYLHSYAFIGMGNHALQNLYPVLDYLHVPLKYIVTRSNKSAKTVRALYPECQGTTDLDKVLNDESVKGVFICTTPSQHHPIVQRVLSSGKHLFVEKPPSFSLQELDSLIEIQKKKNVEVFVGLQRRYSPVVSILKNRLKKVNHYIYRYVTGAFPEGDVLFELFIHPVDLARYLFGKMSMVSCLRTQKTYLLSVRHENGVIGNIELSTHYSWRESFEYLSVNCDTGVFFLDGQDSLLFSKKPKLIARMPIEKLSTSIPEHLILFNRNSFVPNIKNNDLLVHGYYDELKSFVEFCEGGKPALNRSTLNNVRDTYLFLDHIRTYNATSPL